jgi:hypothetical protein
VGLITPPPRIPAQAQNRVAYLRGEPVAALQGGEVIELARLAAADRQKIHDALLGRAPSEAHPPRRRSGRKPSSAEYPNQIPRPIVR